MEIKAERTDEIGIGEEILIRVKVVNFDSNPHGCAVQIEIPGYIDDGEIQRLDRVRKLPNSTTRIWIHRLDQPKVIVGKCKWDITFKPGVK